MPVFEIPLPLAQDQNAPSILSSFGLPLVIFAIIYFMLFRPMLREKKRNEEAQRNAQQAIKRGSRVVTQAGIIARVQTIREKDVTLDLDGSARMTVRRDSILRILDEDATGEKPAAGAKNGAAAAESGR